MTRLEENLRGVRERIAAAARSAGRDPASVALLAVSKTWPADDVRALAALGQRDFGENRAQELVAKAARAGGDPLPVRWHFVGQLQRNKAAAVARLGAVVHSVDRRSLAEVLDRAGQESGRSVEVLLQVDLGGTAAERGTARRGRPRGDPGAGRRGRRSARPAAPGAHGRRAPGRGPGAGVRAAGGPGRPGPGRPSGGRRAVRGHERRPRGRRSRRARRSCVSEPRCSAIGP